jgi:hypothetical protein
MATQVPHGPQPESRVKRFARWGDNDTRTAEVYVIPSAEVLLGPLAWQPLVVSIEGRVVGRGGVALMRHVVYKGRVVTSKLVTVGIRGWQPR